MVFTIMIAFAITFLSVLVIFAIVSKKYEPEPSQMIYLNATQPYLSVRNAMYPENNHYYVYLHRVKNRIVYVGKGTGGRAYDVRRSDLEHIQLLYDAIENNNIESVVQIWRRGLTEEKALVTEKAMILLHKPCFNTVGVN